MSNVDESKQIEARYRAYCDACQTGRLDEVPSFWSLPALFTVDIGGSKTQNVLLRTPDEMVAFYGQLFGSSTGVDKTIIDDSKVEFYGANLATIKTSLRHMVGAKLHDKQNAIYGCRRVDGAWVFVSHLSVDIP